MKYANMKQIASCIRPYTVPNKETGVGDILLIASLPTRFPTNQKRRSRDSVAGITTGYRLKDRGSELPSSGTIKNFLFSKSSRQDLGSTQPPIKSVPGAFSPGVKRPGRKPDHSSPTSAEVKKMWMSTFSLP
jgi:hypothetical protein